MDRGKNRWDDANGGCLHGWKGKSLKNTYPMARLKGKITYTLRNYHVKQEIKVKIVSDANNEGEEETWEWIYLDI